MAFSPEIPGYSEEARADLLDGVETRKPQLAEYLQSIERRLKEREEPQAIG